MCMAQVGGSPDRAGNLCFEISETAAITSSPRPCFSMQEVKKRGLPLPSLDDFGTGMSRSTISRACPWISSRSTASSSAASPPIRRSQHGRGHHQGGRALGIATIAERVETAEALERLKQLGVDFGPGLLSGRDPNLCGPWVA